MISLGIGDTTEPIPDVITSAMAKVRIPCPYPFWGIISGCSQDFSLLSSNFLQTYVVGNLLLSIYVSQ